MEIQPRDALGVENLQPMATESVQEECLDAITALFPVERQETIFLSWRWLYSGHCSSSPFSGCFKLISGLIYSQSFTLEFYQPSVCGAVYSWVGVNVKDHS